MIGNRLKLARDAAGLSLRALEEAVDGLVSAQAIGKYENDQMMPGSDVLLALARVLKVSPEYLLSDREVALSGVDFRKGPATGAREEKAVEAIVIDHLERYLEVEDILPDAHLNWAAPRLKALAISTPEDAEDAAEALRGAWQIGIDPIPSMAELLEDYGVKVIALDLPQAVSGSKAFARRNGERDVAVIVVNKNHNGERQRFTLAHELGHLVLTLQGEAWTDKTAEKACDRFAGAFLVARSMLYKRLGRVRTGLSMGELLELKGLFKVSVSMLVLRCKQLGIISQALFNRLWGQMVRMRWAGKAAVEPQPCAPEVPTRMERLCLRAATEQAISDAKAAELLQISVRTLGERLLPAGV
ncbi:helix-turn-helix domain-containing protein [Ramlibacter sp.]|uniref:helix-turn-helix domain-containing protein n=1 Tax=Ramlibacter sp. TaxID=1917967 RepID=UPI0035B0EEA3